MMDHSALSVVGEAPPSNDAYDESGAWRPLSANPKWIVNMLESLTGDDRLNISFTRGQLQAARLTGEIPDAQIPSTIARESELPTSEQLLPDIPSHCGSKRQQGCKVLRRHAGLGGRCRRCGRRRQHRGGDSPIGTYTGAEVRALNKKQIWVVSAADTSLTFGNGSSGGDVYCHVYHMSRQTTSILTIAFPKETELQGV